jgi:hypothetical protein
LNDRKIKTGHCDFQNQPLGSETELREAIERAAEREARSISNWIERALQKAIDDEERGQDKRRR